jgi:hypothetical protein
LATSRRYAVRRCERTSHRDCDACQVQSVSGKSVTSDKDSKSYKVDNPETLKGKEDQHVALIVQADPNNNVIHIIQVEPQQ